MRLSKKNYQQAFRALDQVLTNNRALWSESAFVQEELSWRHPFPILHRDLFNLPEQALLSLSEEQNLRHYLATYIPELDPTADWQISPAGPAQWQTPQRALFGLPGRKKRQTEGFVSAISEFLGGFAAETGGAGNIVDWCSGRGLLARQLHYASGSRVLCLERDPGLCRSGQLANERMDLSMARQVSFRAQDVLGSLEPECFENSYLHTALHACGDLHISMLEQVTAARVPALACSPCCYHLMTEETYQGLSEEGRHSLLKPSKNELRLASAETCTANALEQELRQRELLWRIAFDLHLRDITGVDLYTPTPSVKKSLLKTSFQEFAQSASSRLRSKGHSEIFFTLSEQGQTQLLERATAKFSKIKRLEKVQLGFRQALEYWLLLDRVLFLQEQGYDVQLQEFCCKRDSGRNILLFASLADGP